jgi:hypothetical protein
MLARPWNLRCTELLTRYATPEWWATGEPATPQRRGFGQPLGVVFCIEQPKIAPARTLELGAIGLCRIPNVAIRRSSLLGE